MKILSRLISKGGIISKATEIAEKAVVDKDKRNELIFNIASQMMKSNLAPYIRGVLAIVIVIGIMFFGETITLSPEERKYTLYTVLGFYFLDRVFSSKLGK